MHVTQIGAVLAPFLRRADAQEMHVGELGRHVVVGGEPKPALGKVFGQQCAQAGLVERDVAAGELGHLARVDVDPDDLMPEFRHSDGVGGTQVAGAEDGASHTTVCRLPR